MRITEKVLAEFAPEPGRRVATLYLEEGLTLKATRLKSGTISRSYVFRYSLNGVQYSDAIGTPKDLTLEQARKICAEYRGYVKAGKRPKDYIKEAVDASATQAVTLRQVAELYIERSISAGRRERTLRKIRFYLKVLEPFMDKPLGAISYKEAAAWVQGMVGAGTLAKAKAAACLFVRLMDLAVDLGYILEHVLARLPRLVPAGRVTHLRSVDADNPEPGIEEVFRDFIPNLPPIPRRLMVLGFYTLLRPTEAAALRIEDVDFKAGILTCRQTKTSDGPFVIKLNPALEKLLRELTGGRQAGPIIGCGGRPETARIKTGIALKRLGCPIVPHGWRAAGVAWMIRHEVPLYVAEACLCHAIGGAVTQAYARTSLFDERGAALARWNEYLEGVRERNCRNLTFEKKSRTNP